MRLKAIRDKRGVTLRELQTRSGVHFVTIHEIEAGKRNPRLSTLRKLAKALGVKVSDLIGE
jgi:transcriptional regulator with XRE-family HTH domain